MHNIVTTVEGDELVVRINIGKGAVSAAPHSSSGKTVLVGSTGGALPIPCSHASSMSLSLNLMAKR